MPDDLYQAQALAAIFQGFKWPELIAKKTRVFLAHMNLSLGSRLFLHAKNAGMMSEEYAWIITEYFSNFLSSMDFFVRDSMEGVLGIRPYVQRSEKLNSFQKSWKMNMGSTGEVNVYSLWVYDAVCSLAMAAEKIGPVNSSSLYMNTSKNGTGNTDLKVSAYRPRLLSELSGAKLRGMIGDFQFINGQLKPLVFEIFNVIGSGERTLGFWIPEKGISRELISTGKPTNSASTKNLKNAIWPGDCVTQPKGWAIPATGKLRVGVPMIRGFKQFVDVTIYRATHRTNATGFSIDIFLATLQLLPFDYKIRILLLTFDVVVGDITIWAPRANYVDFSLPYSEPGVTLVVKNKKPFDMWIFIKPLHWDLWIAIIIACILMGIVLRILEHRVPNTDEDSIRPHRERLKMTYWSPIAVLAFPESIDVLAVHGIHPYAELHAYTANLSAILTVDQLKFAFSDEYYVGYQEGSFMREFLKVRLNINESRLRSYSSVEEYHDTMSKGSKRGGMDAIFDEIPYMKIFLNKYDSQYKMVGPRYRTDGFGFAFPLGSPLTAYFSRAIVAVTQGPNMTFIEQTHFGPGYSSQDPLSSTISQQTSSLSFRDFGGLFIIVGLVTMFALICSETSLGRKVTAQFSQMCFRFMPSEFPLTRNDRKEVHESVPETGALYIEEAPSLSEEEICEPGQNNETATAEDQEGNIDNHQEGIS
ncbi:glutamate receptor 2.1-like [Olea europaea var. sylvestris]|uniref:glutamate receptor 2.1-like n=1 Tax=Olea europaea var. sylvestris TaxID=158386 RepID=UPI000C1D6A33|nr:glutamate receptor 2.1-like [Olea europaea var. sylvestris]